MAHGIFPTTNKYYLATELFPYLSKQEKKEVYFSTKKPKYVPGAQPVLEDEDTTGVKYEKNK